MLENFLTLGNPWIWVIIAAIVTITIAFTARKFSTYTKFVYPNAKFEAIGNPWLKNKKISDLAESKNLDSFKDNVNTIKDYQVEGKDSYQIQESIDQHFLETVEMMRKDNPKKMQSFFDSYMRKYDFYLIKKTLKQKLRGLTVDENVIDRALLKETEMILRKLLNAEDKEQIIEVLRRHDFKEEIIDAIEQEETDLLKIDVELDKQMIEMLKDTTVPHKCEKGKKRFVDYYIDIINLKNVLRAKENNFDLETIEKMFIGEGREIRPWKYKELAEQESVSQIISKLEGTSFYEELKNSIEEYNKDKSVQPLTLALDRTFLQIVKDISTDNYTTIGPTIRFIVSKEFETRNLKAVAKGVGEEFSKNTIDRNLVTEVSP